MRPATRCIVWFGGIHRRRCLRIRHNNQQKPAAAHAYGGILARIAPINGGPGTYRSIMAGQMTKKEIKPITKQPTRKPLAQNTLDFHLAESPFANHPNPHARIKTNMPKANTTTVAAIRMTISMIERVRVIFAAEPIYSPSGQRGMKTLIPRVPLP
jgi:hypothetical protein